MIIWSYGNENYFTCINVGYFYFKLVILGWMQIGKFTTYILDLCIWTTGRANLLELGV